MGLWHKVNQIDGHRCSHGDCENTCYCDRSDDGCWCGECSHPPVSFDDLERDFYESGFAQQVLDMFERGVRR